MKTKVAPSSDPPPCPYLLFVTSATSSTGVLFFWDSVQFCTRNAKQTSLSEVHPENALSNSLDFVMSVKWEHQIHHPNTKSTFSITILASFILDISYQIQNTLWCWYTQYSRVKIVVNSCTFWHSISRPQFARAYQKWQLKGMIMPIDLTKWAFWNRNISETKNATGLPLVPKFLYYRGLDFI